MHTIEEINARLAEINGLIDNATPEELTALEGEASQLIAERTALQEAQTRRQQLRSQVAAGSTGVVTATSAPAAAPARESVEQAEIRSFAAFVRGTITQMRTGEQNFSYANNGALIPTTIARRIIDAVTERCPILQGADVYHVKGQLKIPVYGNANTTHNIAVGYAADFTELTADAGAFTSVDLGGFLFGALSLIGKTLVNNADIDIVNFVVNKMADDIAIFVEKELLVGTSGKCTGALSTSNTVNAGSTSAISADNLIDLQAKIKTVFQANAVWVMHPDTFSAIKKLKDGNNRYLLQDDVSGEFPYRLLGKPVHLSDNMPKIASAAKAVLYGDYSGLSVNIREDVSVEILREKYATQHALGVVAYMEMDSKVSNPQKLATLVMSA